MDKEKKCCRNCKYWIYEEIDKGHICCNADSEFVADWTEENDYCLGWERKDDTGFPITLKER